MTISSLNLAQGNNQPLDFTKNEKIQVTTLNGKKTIAISCPTAIRDVLANKEIKEKTFPFPDPIAVRVRDLNMMTCPFSQHASLRSPFEKTFTRSEVKKHVPLILDKLLNEFRNAVFDPKNVGREVIESILQNLTTSLSPELEEDSKGFIKVPAELLVGATMQTILVLLEKYPDESEKIQNEWLDFLKNLPLDNQFTIFEKFQTFVLGGKLNDNQYSPSKYIDAFVKETLRLYPPLANIPRLPFDNAFDLHGIAIRPGDVILLELRKSQIDSSLEKQNEFFPERFLNEASLTEKLPRDLLCYSSGVKQCLGQHLANIEFLILTGLCAIFSPIDRQKADTISLPSYQEDNPIIFLTQDQTINSPLPRFLALSPLEYAQNFLKNPNLSSPEEVELFAKLPKSSANADSFNTALKLFGVKELLQLNLKELDMVVFFASDFQQLSPKISFSNVLKDFKKYTSYLDQYWRANFNNASFYFWSRASDHAS